MITPKFREVGSETLECVLSLLNYSSVNSFTEDVKKIQEWMKEQPHLPEIMDAKKVQNFLILNKGSVEKTKVKIDNYYTIRSKMPEIFERINPKLPYFQDVLSAVYFLPLPMLTKDLHRVFWYRTRDKVLVERSHPVDIVRYLVSLQELRLTEDVTFGDVFIVDGKDVSLAVISKITPIFLHKTLVLIYKKVFSNRLKGVYLINAPPFVDKFVSILKLVLKPKLIDRIHICPNADVLIELFGKKMIPRDYGGEEKSFNELQDIAVETFQAHREHFDRLDVLRVDEKLRPEKLTDDEVLGYYGNFKKLEID